MISKLNKVFSHTYFKNALKGLKYRQTDGWTNKLYNLLEPFCVPPLPEKKNIIALAQNFMVR